MTACAREMASSLAGVLGGQQFGGGDVGSDLTTFITLPGRADDGIVGGLNPDFLSVLADAPVFAGVEFAAPELGPERLVVGTVGRVRVDEQAVRLAFDFSQLIAEKAAEVFVGARSTLPVGSNSTIARGAAQGLEYTLGVAAKIGMQHR